MVNILTSNNCTGKHLTMYKRMRSQMILHVCKKDISKINSEDDLVNNEIMRQILKVHFIVKYDLYLVQVNLVSKHHFINNEKRSQSLVKMLERFINGSSTTTGCSNIGVLRFKVMVPCPISEYDIKVEGTVYPVFFTCHKICENEEMCSIFNFRQSVFAILYFY